MILCISTFHAAGYKGLSSLADHYIERSRCLNDFKSMYGGVLPLPHSSLVIQNLMAENHNMNLVENLAVFSTIFILVLLIFLSVHKFCSN